MSQQHLQADLLTLTPQVSVPTLPAGQVAFGPEGLVYGTTGGNKQLQGQSNVKLIVPVGASVTRTGGAIVINGGPLVLTFPKQTGFFNTIGVQTSPSMADGQAAYVLINRAAIASNPLTIQVGNIATLPASDDLYILAVRNSGVIYFGPELESRLANSNDSTVDSFLGPLIVNEATASSYFPNLKNGLVYFDTTLGKYRIYSTTLAAWGDLGSSSNDDVAYLKTGSATFAASGVMSGPVYTDISANSGNGSAFAGFNQTDFVGQSFIPNSNLAITQIQTHIRKSGNPDANVVMEIYEWSPTGGVPNATGGTRGLTPIATSNPVAASGVTTSTTTLTPFVFPTPPLVIPSKQYVFLMRIQNVVVYDVSNRLFVNYAGVDNYANGSFTQGATGNVSLGGVAADMNFLVEGQASTVPGLTLSANTFIQVANLPSSYHTILAQQIPFTSDDQVAYISIDRSENTPTNRSVFVEDLSLFAQDGNKIIIARRVNGKAYMGIFDTTQIADGQTVSFDAPSGAVKQFVESAMVPSFSGSHTTYTTAPGLEVTIVSTGRPISVQLEGDSGVSNDASYVSVNYNAGTVWIAFLLDNTTLYPQTIGTGGLSGTSNLWSPPSAFRKTLNLPAGTYNLKVQTKQSGGTGAHGLFRTKLTAYELA